MLEIISIARSISSRVLVRQSEKRMLDRAVLRSIPICVRTRDGSIAPEAQAEPWLTAMPAISRCISNVSPSMPGKAMFEVLEMRGPSP